MNDLKKGARIGPYTIVEVLPEGRGGMARVYRARQEQVQDHKHYDIALKISRYDYNDPRYNNALKQEVDILKRLRHPNIVSVLPLPLGSKQDPFMARAIELPGSPWFYAMEYLQGGSLLDVAPRKAPLPFQVGCAIGVRLVDALMYIHSQGIVHMDVKPENVLFRYPPEKEELMDPVLIDFGVAARTKTVSATGGTLWTMAPEHIRHTRGEIPPETELDKRKMDVYSLGVVVYRMWTGHFPFDGLTSRSVTNAVLNSAIRPPRIHVRDLPDRTDTLMENWLQKDPNWRPSLHDIRSYLISWSDGLNRFPEMPRQKSGLTFWKK